MNVTGGTLVAANAALLGATNGGTFISGGGTLDVFNKNLGLERGSPSWARVWVAPAPSSTPRLNSKTPSASSR